MSETWSRPAVEKLIQLIKQQECIWNVASYDYSNNYKEDIAFRKIAKEMQDQISGVTVQDVREQWMLMLREFNAELQEVLRRKSVRRVHVLKLWYFDKLLFLNKKLQDETVAVNRDELWRLCLEGRETFRNEPLIEPQTHHEPQTVLPPVEVYIQEDEELSAIMESSQSDDNQQVAAAKRKRKRKSNETLNWDENTDDSTQSSSEGSDCSWTKAKRKPKNNVKYDWLGGFVVGQMDLIKPKYHATVAWELQCLMRKYVQKSEEA